MTTELLLITCNKFERTAGCKYECKNGAQNITPAREIL